jgi:hypothetical protein
MMSQDLTHIVAQLGFFTFYVTLLPLHSQESIVLGKCLRQGKSKSCGCYSDYRERHRGEGVVSPAE